MAFLAAATLFIAAATASAAPVPSELLAQAVTDACTVACVRVSVERSEPRVSPGCMVEAAQATAAVEASGKISLRLQGKTASGRACSGWAWVDATLWVSAAVTTRAVARGENLGSAVKVEERPLARGHVPALAPELEGQVAARFIPKGTLIEAMHVEQPATRAGATVKVVVSIGSLAVEQEGRAVPCGAGRACAVLPSGRHVEGELHEGRLWVRMQ